MSDTPDNTYPPIVVQEALNDILAVGNDENGEEYGTTEKAKTKLLGAELKIWEYFTQPSVPADEIAIPLLNGGTLRCGPDEEYAFGGDIRICDREGNEIVMWSKDEWGESPAEVIGAAFQAAAMPTIEALLKNLGKKRVIDGVWVC